jgi:N-formylglutamate amidohydrolase
MRPLPLILPVALLLPLPLFAQEKPDLAKLLTVRKGTLPIVISAPHGGRLAIPGADERKGVGVEKFVTVNDTNTDLLAEKLAAAIKKEMGGEPYVVIAHFQRKFVDANRPPEGGYESDLTKPVYAAYHKALKEASDDIQKQWGRGLVLDLHGQAAKADTIFRGTNDLKTVARLKDRFGAKAVTGQDSVLGVLAKKGYLVFPANDTDAKEDTRFNGGYISKTYGGSSGTGLDALQLELGGDHRSKANIDPFARDLAAAVKTFAKAYLPEKRKDEK